MQQGLSIVVLLGIVGLLAFFSVGGYYLYNQQKLISITDFESCSKKYPALLSYPGQCTTPDGRHFVQQLSNEEQKKLIPPSNFVDKTSDRDSAVTDFESCAKLYPVMESYPEQCRTPNGKYFVKQLNEKD